MDHKIALLLHIPALNETAERRGGGGSNRRVDVNRHNELSSCDPRKHPKQIHNFVFYDLMKASRDSSVGIALGYGLNDRGSRVRFPVGAGNFSLHHRV
jgi:hypothetical protein